MPLADHSTPGPLADHSTSGLLTVSPGLLTVSSLPWFGSTPAGKAAGTCILRAFGLQMSCRLSVLLPLFCFAFLFFRLYAFVEAAALRSTVLRYAGAPIATRVFFFGNVAFSEYFFVPLPLSLCMESTSYVLSFRMVFFYLGTSGWIFDSSLCENSINQSRAVHIR